MTACVLTFAIPPERLGHDASRYMDPAVGPTWPQERHKVVLNDLKPELQNPEKTEPLAKQLDSRGFAVVKNKSKTLGSLASQAEWNAAYLEVSTRNYGPQYIVVLIQGVLRKQRSMSTILH